MSAFEHANRTTISHSMVDAVGRDKFCKALSIVFRETDVTPRCQAFTITKPPISTNFKNFVKEESLALHSTFQTGLLHPGACKILVPMSNRR